MIVGMHLSTHEGEINSWVDKLFGNLPEWIKKPLYDCPTCMASVHSTYVYWYIYNGTEENWIRYLPYIFALSALNTLIMVVINACKKIME